MAASNRGWLAVRKLFQELRPHLTPDQVASWEKHFEDNEPF